MASIPPYRTWMQDTYAIGHSKRTGFLKAVDAAILAYERSPSAATKEAVKTALDRWRFEKSREGKDWKSSVRNRKGAVTALYRALETPANRGLSAEELEALRYISRAQSMALAKQFQGAEVTFKASTLAGLAQGAGTNWQRFKTGSQSVVQGAKMGKGFYKTGTKIRDGVEVFREGGRGAAQAAGAAGMREQILQVESFIKELCPGVDANEVLGALGLGNVATFSADLAPFVGALSSGGKAIKGWIGVIRTDWQRTDFRNSRFAFAPEDPEAALDAVLELLTRDLHAQMAQAGVATGAFTGKTLGVFLDAGAVTGPVIGLLETLAGIFQTIVDYVRDIHEVNRANELLRLGALNLELFQVCPILGCYFLVVQDHSTIINFAVGDYGTPNFVFDAERLVKKIDPVLGKAQEYIHASRFEIAAFRGHKGVVKQHWSVKGPMAHVGKDQVQPTGVRARNRAEAIKDSMANQIREWRKKPVKPPKVDTTRITGFGSAPGGGFGTRPR